MITQIGYPRPRIIATMLTVVSFIRMDLANRIGRKEKIMSKKTSTYYPNYQLRYRTDVTSKSIWFTHAGIYFVTKLPLFGATETHKEALKWAQNSIPPVICVKHEALVASDRRMFCDPRELHRSFAPYAMAIATIYCLGEESPRKIKIYFCDIELHEDNVHVKSKGTYIVPIV